MRISKGELREIIREEFMRGVPEFMLRKATDDCVTQVRAQVMKFIQVRSEDPTHRRELTKLADDVFEELDEKLYQTLEDSLYQFLQNT
ncbi:MAG: hypothetical protein WCT07_04065 [Candidatus Paceibacterota bacterium]|jgi:hypothetical protein